MDERQMRLKELFQENQAVFVALGDPFRQRILLLMGEQTQLSVGEIAALTELSRPTVSHHIKILRDANLVLRQRIGVRNYYRPEFRHNLPAMREMVDHLEELDKISS